VKRGKVALTVCSTSFIGLGRAQQKALGYPDLPIALVPHPFGTRKRDELRGRLRLAYEYYEMAEILRLLLRRATGEDLPIENDYGAEPWAASTRKTKTTAADRLVLKRNLRNFGLDGGYRGHWFVEGHTEEAFFRELCQLNNVDLEQAGISLTNLGGRGQIAKRLPSHTFMAELRRHLLEEIFVYITVDDDEGIRQGLETLRHAGLLSAGYTRWSDDFEGSNFSDQELVSVVLGITGARGTVSFSTSDVAKARIDKSGQTRPTGKALEVAAGRYSPLRGFAKGTRWGKGLARFAQSHPELNGARRQALEIFELALSMSWADFAGTVENMECGADGKLVSRKQPKEDS